MDAIIQTYVLEKQYQHHGDIISREKGPYITGTGFYYDSPKEDGNCSEYSIWPNGSLTDLGQKFLGEKLAYEFEKILEEENQDRQYLKLLVYYKISL